MKKALGASLLAALLTACAGYGEPSYTADEVARQALPINDGWAFGLGALTGGSAASSENIVTVSTRKELVDTLARLNVVPKVIYIKGTINLSTDDSGRELTEKDYTAPGYDFEAYKRAYDPNVWNRQPLVKGKPPVVSGPLEEAREASVKNQRKQIEINVPSNTSLIGLGDDAKMIHGNLLLGKGTENVIIRNIAFEDAFDFFPAWDAGDSYSAKRTEPVVANGVNYTVSGCQEKFVDALHGPQRCIGGRWNSEYDLISINGASRVWIDHCTFSDGERFDKQYPPVFSAPYNLPEQKVQHHDGLIDITNQASFVTLSYNHFHHHDKVGLIGGSDSRKDDDGKLKVTLHHNLFENTKQRQPRVRFGQVHSYNNYFVGSTQDAQYPFAYGVGLGIQAKVVSENNYFDLNAGVAPAELISVFNKDATLIDRGTILNGKPVDVLADFNAKNPNQKISSEVGWVPQRVVKLIPTISVPAYVRANAGVGKIIKPESANVVSFDE